MYGNPVCCVGGERKTSCDHGFFLNENSLNNSWLQVDKDLTAKHEPKISPLALAILLKYANGKLCSVHSILIPWYWYMRGKYCHTLLDHLIVSLAEDVFKVLAKNPACFSPVLQRLLPTLVSILQAPVDKIPMGMQAVSLPSQSWRLIFDLHWPLLYFSQIALDILVILVRNCPSALPDGLINTAFPAAVQCTMKSDDSATLQVLSSLNAKRGAL